jgi:hypothetical protein
VAAHLAVVLAHLYESIHRERPKRASIESIHSEHR